MIEYADNGGENMFKNRNLEYPDGTIHKIYIKKLGYNKNTLYTIMIKIIKILNQILRGTQQKN